MVELPTRLLIAIMNPLQQNTWPYKVPSLQDNIDVCAIEFQLYGSHPMILEIEDPTSHPAPTIFIGALCRAILRSVLEWPGYVLTANRLTN
jgi:hypothetical protein